MVPGTHLGLVEVTTHDLKKALRALHHGDLDLPVTAAAISRIGLQHCSGPLLAQMRDLDHAGVHAVLTAVLAERLSR